MYAVSYVYIIFAFNFNYQDSQYWATQPSIVRHVTKTVSYLHKQLATSHAYSASMLAQQASYGHNLYLWWCYLQSCSYNTNSLATLKLFQKKFWCSAGLHVWSTITQFSQNLLYLLMHFMGQFIKHFEKFQICHLSVYKTFTINVSYVNFLVSLITGLLELYLIIKVTFW